MTHPIVEPEGATLAAPSLVAPAPIRLVHAFRDAAKGSIPEADLSEESLAVEILVMAGNAAFEALARFECLLREVAREGRLADDLDPWAIVLASEIWLDAADSLRDRLVNLETAGYDSEAFQAFSEARTKAQATFSEGCARRGLERRALRTDKLAALAAKLLPRQEVYDEKAGG